MDLQTKIKTWINSTFKSSGGDFTNLMHLSKSVIIIETEECLPPPPPSSLSPLPRHQDPKPHWVSYCLMGLIVFQGLLSRLQLCKFCELCQHPYIIASWD